MYRAFRNDRKNCTLCLDRFGRKERILQSHEIRFPGRFFSWVSIAQWLKFLLPLLFGQLRLNFNEQKKHLHDLYDGRAYQRLKKRDEKIRKINQDSTSHSLTLTIGFDGSPCAKNGAASVWPILGYLNKLPLNLRYRFPMTFAVH